jgi:cytochrome b
MMMAITKTIATPADLSTAPRTKVWDPVVRLFHWVVVTGVIANLTVLSESRDLHRYVGYVVFGAVVVRLAWGFIGRGHARFASFMVGPRAFLAYARAIMRGKDSRYVGHNPAGTAMIVLLVMLLVTVSVTGWMMGTDRFWGVAWVEQAHELSANAILAAAIIHVLGAVVESVRHRENLPLAMITGYKRAASGTDIDNAPAPR